MGKYRWDVQAVWRGCDDLEKILLGIRPVIDSANEKIRRIRKMKGLPGYVTSRLDNMLFDYEREVDRVMARIDNVRADLPKVGRANRQKVPSRLIREKTYQVVIGGCGLRADVEEKSEHLSYTWFRPQFKRPRIGSVIIYKGTRTDLFQRDKTPRDAFEFEGFTGAFEPLSADGRADRTYLKPFKA